MTLMCPTAKMNWVSLRQSQSFEKTQQPHREHRGAVLPVCCHHDQNRLGQRRTMEIHRRSSSYFEQHWNTFSGLLPPTSQPVETALTCHGQSKYIEKRCRRLRIDIVRQCSAKIGYVCDLSYSINSPALAPGVWYAEEAKVRNNKETVAKEMGLPAYGTPRWP